MLNWIFLEKDLCNPNNTDNSDDTLASDSELEMKNCLALFTMEGMSLFKATLDQYKENQNLKYQTF